MSVVDSYSLVLDTLRRAASQNAALLKPAEQQLKSWETQPGFYSTLLSVFSDHSVDVNVRWIAILYFKNGIDRYWRKTAPKLPSENEIFWPGEYSHFSVPFICAISEDERQLLKRKLISRFDEPVNQLALQLAVLISKIARFDCPREWPELIPTLLEAVRADNEIQQHRALLTLHHVVKSLSSKRLSGDRRIFQELTSSIFTYVLQLWTTHTETFLVQVTQKQPNEATLQKALLSLKVLRKLAVYGFKTPHLVQDAVLFINIIFQRIRPFLECRRNFEPESNLRELCQKYVIVLTKVLHDILEIHPFSFVQYIRLSLECAVSLCFTEAGQGLLFERFIVQCFNLIKAILLCPEYKLAKVPEDTKEPATLEANNRKLEFFTYSTLTEICRRLLSHYFLLTEEDLTIWEDDPEEFACDEGGEAWKFSLRPSTEVLFLSLFHEYRQTLAPLLLEMVRNIQNLGNSADQQVILHKDAVYNAVGLAAFDLYDEIDFDNWFVQVLIPELKIKVPSYHIVRRRVIWLIGQWVGVKLSPDLRPLLYETILSLLNSQEDLVVRLTAANVLKVAVDDFEFSTEQFLPYLESSVNLLYRLLKETSECDTKMTLLHVFSFVIERVGSQIRPYAANLVEYLPLLWEMSGDHNMLRCAIITNLVHLVQGLGTLSEKLHGYLLPIISYSTDVSQPPHVYLLEDGLSLWWAVLENTSVCSSELLAIGCHLFPLLELGSENLNMCLQIIQAYVLLSPQDFLRKYGNDLVKTCCDIIKDLRSEGVICIMRLVELILRVFPEEGPQLFHPLLPFILSSIMDGEEPPVVLSQLLSVIARIVLHNKECLMRVIQEKANQDGQEPEEVFTSLLKVWLEKMPLLYPLERRKLLGLALTSLLTSGSRVVHYHICGLLLAIVEVLNDVIKTDDLGAQIDSVVLIQNEQDIQAKEEEETEHDRRKRDLSCQDPVYTVALKAYLCSQMAQLQMSLGPTAFEELMSSVDVETMEQLREYLHS